MVMIEKNSLEIARLLDDWMQKKREVMIGPLLQAKRAVGLAVTGPSSGK